MYRLRWRCPRRARKHPIQPPRNCLELVLAVPGTCVEAHKSELSAWVHLIWPSSRMFPIRSHRRVILQGRGHCVVFKMSSATAFVGRERDPNEYLDYVHLDASSSNCRKRLQSAEQEYMWWFPKYEGVRFTPPSANNTVSRSTPTRLYYLSEPIRNRLAPPPRTLWKHAGFFSDFSTVDCSVCIHKKIQCPVFLDIPPGRQLFLRYSRSRSCLLVPLCRVYHPDNRTPLVKQMYWYPGGFANSTTCVADGQDQSPHR